MDVDVFVDELLDDFPEANVRVLADLPLAIEDGIICCQKRFDDIIAERVEAGSWNEDTIEASKRLYTALMKEDKKKKPKKG